MAERTARVPDAPTVARPSRAAAARLDPGLSRIRGSRAGSRSTLSVGAAGDSFEREADRTADRVSAALRSRSATGSPSRPTHRCGAGCVQRNGGSPAPAGAEVDAAGGAPSSGFAARVALARGRGRALPDGVRSSMESAFGTDFSRVRVHADSSLAGRVASTAFTLGRDIHFAPGAYEPARPSGQWLLAHELTHVVQQNGRGTPAVQRHASKEHYLLGALTIKEIANLAKAKESAIAINSKTMKAAKKKRRLRQKQDPTHIRHDPDFVDALQTIQEQLKALERWRTATVDNPDPARVQKGGTTYDRSQGGGMTSDAKFEHQWGGQLVTVSCLDGELACTVGDLNALPDFFGSLDDVATVSRQVVFKTLQVIRRETLVYLNALLAELIGSTYTYDAGRDNFSSLRKNKVSLPGAGSDLGNAAFDVMQTETMLAGNTKKGEVGLPTKIGASATLGRNACHFPPESWLRWLDHHRRARALVRGAASIADLNTKANRAIALNAFGEHYLQDSFAAGHLINKGFVMAEAMTYLTDATKRNQGFKKRHIAAFQAATAHEAAYDLPQSAYNRSQEEEHGRPVTPVPALDKRRVTRARDPQTALERGRARVAAGGSEASAKRAEVRGIGLAPGEVGFDMYRYWLNDFWLQKITNTLHDKWCVEGLTVGSPTNRDLFRIYGDSHMLRAAEGTAETSRATRMSHHAINAEVDNKRRELSPHDTGQREPVTTEAEIMAHFPDQVRVAGTAIPLKDWATGPHMKRVIKNLVELSLTSVGEGKLTGAVRVASPLKTVSAGLGAEHAPF